MLVEVDRANKFWCPFKGTSWKDRKNGCEGCKCMMWRYNEEDYGYCGLAGIVPDHFDS